MTDVELFHRSGCLITQRAFVNQFGFEADYGGLLGFWHFGHCDIFWVDLQTSEHCPSVSGEKKDPVKSMDEVHRS